MQLESVYLCVCMRGGDSVGMCVWPWVYMGMIALIYPIFKFYIENAIWFYLAIYIEEVYISQY